MNREYLGKEVSLKELDEELNYGPAFLILQTKRYADHIDGEIFKVKLTDLDRKKILLESIIGSWWEIDESSMNGKDFLVFYDKDEFNTFQSFGNTVIGGNVGEEGLGVVTFIGKDSKSSGYWIYRGIGLPTNITNCEIEKVDIVSIYDMGLFYGM